MISRELLSEVLNESRVILDYEVSICGKEIHYGHTDIDEDGFINIYELAHKCKEWATPIHSQYFLTIFIGGISETTHIRQYGVDIVDKDLCNIAGFTAVTEYEAIFKACEWILDNKETK